jgi:hypothetical protein
MQVWKGQLIVLIFIRRKIKSHPLIIGWPPGGVSRADYLLNILVNLELPELSMFDL